MWVAHGITEVFGHIWDGMSYAIGRRILRHSKMCGTKRVKSGTPEAFNYVGCDSVCCGAIWEADKFLMYLATRAGHFAAMWLVSSVFEAFGYVG